MSHDDVRSPLEGLIIAPLETITHFRRPDQAADFGQQDGDIFNGQIDPFWPVLILKPRTGAWIDVVIGEPSKALACIVSGGWQNVIIVFRYLPVGRVFS